MALFQAKAKGKAGTKELQKLRRQDLLELLIEQMREGDELRASNAQLAQKADELSALVDHLKERLEGKDEVIERLKRRLDIKDRMIAVLLAQGREFPKCDDLFDLAELLEVEQRAIEAYLSDEGVMPVELSGARPVEFPVDQTDGPQLDVESEGDAS